MLCAVDISVRLGSTDVLRGINITIAPGELVAIVGPNGSGKSTLVRTLTGLLSPQTGAVRLNGMAIRSVPSRRRARQLGLLSQSSDAPGLTTVEEHVGLGRHAMRSVFARWTRTDAEAVQHAMTACEVGHLADRRMENLSGGERQRVRLATLLAQGPQYMLLDEPLTGLDIEHQLGLLHLLRSLNEETDRAVVCVLHDLDLALRFFHRIVVIDAGRVAADGPPREVLCPRIFESVFRVDGRVGCEDGGEPVIVCRQCRPARETEQMNIVTQPVEVTRRSTNAKQQGVA